MKTMIKISMVLAIAMLISIMAVATVSATTDVKSEKTNIEITIDSKEKKISSYKITWNANGGKIGSKKTKVTTVKRGSKIKKLVANPKRSGFSFKGWFSKKNGGKKITKNTKPSKNVIYYAKWTKKVSTSTNSKLIGHWERYSNERVSGILYGGYQHYYFYANGKFQFFDDIYDIEKIEGKYSVSNGKVYFKEVKYYGLSPLGQLEKQNKANFGRNYSKYDFGSHNPHSDMTSEYKLSSDKKDNYLQINAPINQINPGGNIYWTLQDARKHYDFKKIS